MSEEYEVKRWSANLPQRTYYQLKRLTPFYTSMLAAVVVAVEELAKKHDVADKERDNGSRHQTN